MNLQTKNYRDQSGERWVIGGTLEIADGGRITKSGKEVELGPVSRKEYEALAARVAALEKGGS